jgi:RND family efflux transporter MFP subunit
MLLQQGKPLFDLYSPQLNLAIEELIAARRAAGSAPPAPDSAARADADALFQAAATKLELWGLRRDQVDALAQLDRAPEAITFPSPITGNLVDKTIVEGAAVEAGMPVMRIVDYSTLWLDARVFEQDLPFVHLGQAVTAAFASEPGKTFQGQVIFIHPQVDPDNRTATVRIALPNPAFTLRPGMYATVQLEAELLPTATTVPREAVIDSGTRQLVFVPHEGGRFEPRPVRVGLTGDDGAVQILQGLQPGEPVVVSGQFLLDSESRLREAIQKFLTEKNHSAPAATQPSMQPAAPHHHPATEDRP